MTGQLQFEPDLLAQVAHRLTLRDPNRLAVEAVVRRTSDHFDVQGNQAPYECLVQSATGVGKTYVMAGLLEYLSGMERPVRNFLLLAPGRTIRDKSVQNFTPGGVKSLYPVLRSKPFVVTANNFTAQSTRVAMEDTSVIKLFIFTVQALTTSTGEGRATHAQLETLGVSLYAHLTGLPDLVILADEYHCYQAQAFSRTIKELKPQLVVGMTATLGRSDAAKVVYRYPLARAMADKLVKIPVVVARRDSRTDVETKLLDGVNLLRYKAAAADAYCADNDLPPVNPVMLVIAADIAEATALQQTLDSVGFDAGAWVGKTLLVHSELTGEDKEQALADLQDVEDPDSAVRIIISVGMLKEGWDVKNVYVIASMRALVSEVMAEQTLGRGMRLPFGRHTGVEILDTLEVLAHERYSDLLGRREALNVSYIDYDTWAAGQRSSSAASRTPTVDAQASPIPPAGPRTGAGISNAAVAAAAPAEDLMVVAVQDLGVRSDQARSAAANSTTVIYYEPLPGREQIVIPQLTAVTRSAEVSLNEIATGDYEPFERLGRTLTAEHSDELRRTKITARHEQDRVRVGTETARDQLRAALPMDIPLAESRDQLVRRVMAVPGVQNRATELGAAQRIVDCLISAMGPDAAEHLSAFGDVCGQRLVSAVALALRAFSRAQVSYEDAVELVPLTKKRQARKRQEAGHADGAFDTQVAFNGWARNLYSHAWFATTPEFAAAGLIDAAATVVVWARLHNNDIPIAWDVAKKYNPDFVVIEDRAGQRIGWLVETKADRDVESAEVTAKLRAAQKWANTANSAPQVTGITWKYLLVSEQDVRDATSWEHLKGFGR